jgi:hypothetical protein
MLGGRVAGWQQQCGALSESMIVRRRVSILTNEQM